MRRIGSGAFAGTKIERFTAPASLRELADTVFDGCSALREVVLNEGLEAMGEGCFAGLGSVRVEVPESLCRVGKDALAGDELTVCLRSAVKKVSGGWAARSKVKQIIIPAGVEEIGERAFFRAGALESVVFEVNSALRRISAEAFAGSGVVEVRIPDGVESIGRRAFAECTKLDEVVFGPKSALGEIGAEAFRDSGLRRLVPPKTLRKVGDAAFMGCGRLEFGKTAFQNVRLGALCFWGSRETARGVRTLVLPEGTESVGEAWLRGSGVREVRVPESVVEIGPRAFAQCRELKFIEFPPKSALREVGDCAFRGSGLGRFVAPSSLRRIGAMAFCGCERLRYVELNEGLEVLGPACFMDTQVVKLGMPRLLRRASNAFYGCAGLRTVWTPAGRLEVRPGEDGAFSATLFLNRHVRELFPHPAFDALHLGEVVFADGRREAWAGPVEGARGVQEAQEAKKVREAREAVGE